MLTKQLGDLPVSGVNKFAVEGQGKIHHVVFAKEKSVLSEKVTPSEEF